MTREMAVFSRYETATDRSLHRARHELERLQARRRGETVLAPIAVTVSGVIGTNDQAAAAVPSREGRTRRSHVRGRLSSALGREMSISPAARRYRLNPSRLRPTGLCETNPIARQSHRRLPDATARRALSLYALRRWRLVARNPDVPVRPQEKRISHNFAKRTRH
jgi:hypothetical protein